MRNHGKIQPKVKKWSSCSHFKFVIDISPHFGSSKESSDSWLFSTKKELFTAEKLSKCLISHMKPTELDQISKFKHTTIYTINTSKNPTQFLCIGHSYVFSACAKMKIIFNNGRNDPRKSQMKDTTRKLIYKSLNSPKYICVYLNRATTVNKPKG